MFFSRKNRKGFTLIELLVVIAIIAILSVVVILTLNPAELLRQARDSNRVSDLSTLKSAISLYLADVSNVNLASTTTCKAGTPVLNCVFFSQQFPPTMTQSSTGFLAANYGPASTTGSTGRGIDATGWVPVMFSLISSGAPIGNLPVDPVNSTTTLDTFGSALIYGYAATTTNFGFKLTAHMESSKYRTGGTSDNETPDGGNSTTTYEQGSNVAM